MLLSAKVNCTFPVDKAKILNPELNSIISFYHYSKLLWLSYEHIELLSMTPFHLRHTVLSIYSFFDYLAICSLPHSINSRVDRTGTWAGRSPF